MPKTSNPDCAFHGLPPQVGGTINKYTWTASGIFDANAAVAKGNTVYFSAPVFSQDTYKKMIDKITILSGDTVTITYNGNQWVSNPNKEVKNIEDPTLHDPG